MNRTGSEGFEGPEGNAGNREIDQESATGRDATGWAGEADAVDGTAPPEADRPGPRYRSVWARILAALRCGPGVFEEIAADPGLTRQALAVVLIANLAAIVGDAVLFAVMVSEPAASIVFDSWQGVLRWLLMFLLVPAKRVTAWLIGAFICTVASRWCSAEPPGFSYWFRVGGFAHAPVALGIVPMVGGLIGGVYRTVLQIVAVRRVAGVSIGIAIVVGLVAVIGPELFFALVYWFVISFVSLALRTLEGDWSF